MNEQAAYSYLKAMRERKASDLYLTVGVPPTLRIEDVMYTLRAEPLAPEEIEQIMEAVLTSRQRGEYETHQELNSALDMGELGRFRVNVYRQRQFPGLVIRRIITTIPDFVQLQLPDILGSLALEKRGLILVTGMTGSGKSTTLASMIDYRNRTEQGHIITIEDPIEYYHEHKKSVITQREVGVDTESFSVAVKNSLRQRPDVILVGEIRDRDVMEQSLNVAETGHLCLATLHTNNAYQTIERIVNFFPEDYHNQIRLNLSMNLKAIACQRLLPSEKGGLVPGLEIMLNQGLIREQIQKGRYDNVLETIEKNTNLGMCSFDQSLLALYREGMISEETACLYSDRRTDMKVKIQKIKLGQDGGTLENLDTSVLAISE